MRKGLAAAAVIIAGISGPTLAADQGPALADLQEEIGQIVQDVVEEARRDGGTVTRDEVRESVGSTVQGVVDKALDNAFQREREPPTPAEIALGLLSGTIKQATTGAAAAGSGSRTDAQTALGLLTGTLRATDDPASDNIIVKPNNAATTLTPTTAASGTSRTATGTASATGGQGAPRTQGGLSVADGQRSMSSAQTRDLDTVLNPRTAEGTADPAATQAAIDGNPLLSAAQAEGMDVTAHAQNEIAGGTGDGAPVLAGFTVQWSETFQNGAGKLSATWGNGADASVQGQLTMRPSTDGKDSGAMVARTGQDAGFSYGLFSFTLAADGTGSPGPAALLWPCGSGENPYRATAYDGVDAAEQHTYSLLWMPAEIRWYVDGRQVGEALKEGVPADAKDGGENLCPGVSTQDGGDFAVFGVTYATPDFGSDGKPVRTAVEPITARGAGNTGSSSADVAQRRQGMDDAAACGNAETAQRAGVFVGHEASKLGGFEDTIGARAGSVLAYTGGQDWDSPNPEWQLSKEFLGGTGRLINWSIPMTPDDSGAAGMREAASGTHNERYAGWARSILASRQGDTGPIYVRTAWELGGEWFPWTQAAQEDPEAFKGAFQQFAASFHGVSDRFQMVWDINSDRGPVEQWYPGDKAVNVISQDIYWTPEYQGPDAAAAFDRSVNGYSRGLAWMADFAKQHGKRMAIPEWGVPSDGQHDSATWIGLMQDWMEKNNVAYANFWNDGHGSGYNGGVHDGDTAAALASFFRDCAG